MTKFNHDRQIILIQLDMIKVCYHIFEIMKLRAPPPVIQPGNYYILKGCLRLNE